MNPPPLFAALVPLLCAGAPSSAELQDGAPAVDRGAPAARPSVVLITIDTLRREHLGCYGYFRDTSPNIDALAREGLVFERAVATMSSTLPSHLSMLTGVYAHEHGRQSNRAGFKHPFVSSPELRSVAEVFAADGYRTAAMVSATPVGPLTGIQTGFETFAPPPRGGLLAEETNERVFRWMDGLQPDEPFFLWVHYWDVHEPNQPPEEFARRWQTDDRQRAWVAERNIDAEALTRKYADGVRIPELYFARSRAENSEMIAKGLEVTDERIHDLMNRYDGDVSYVDEHIGRLFDRMRGQGLWNDTIVVVTSDHGQELGENVHLGHGRITNVNVFVPLVIRFPDGLVGAPRRDPRVVSLTDLMPTLLAFTELNGKEEFLKQATGVNVLSQDFDRPYVLTQRTTERIVDEDGRAKKYALLTERWKFEMPEGKAGRLYDLSGAGESIDVSRQHPDVSKELEDILKAMLEPRLVVRSETVDDAEIEAALEELKKLGYGGD